MGFTGSVLNVKGGVGVSSTLLSDQRTGRRRTAQTEESERERERERLERLQSPETTELQLKRLSAAQGGWL